MPGFANESNPTLVELTFANGDRKQMRESTYNQLRQSQALKEAINKADFDFSGCANAAAEVGKGVLNDPEFLSGMSTAAALAFVNPGAAGVTAISSLGETWIANTLNGKFPEMYYQCLKKPTGNLIDKYNEAMKSSPEPHY